MQCMPKASQLRSALQGTAWYKSKFAYNLRSTLHGKVFAVVMSIALVLALLMSDVWVIAGVNDNLVIDIVLTIVMVLFVIEFVLLSVTDAPYLLSFFWLMDIVGTVSMVFDLSYMYGQDATREQVADGDSASRFMLLRAARAARVGARAGRLSRVLRFLRFLPFLAGGNKQRESVGMASAISKNLSNLLATRVAALTILLVMVIPLFELGTFPQYDHSLQTWVDRLSVNLAAGRTQRMSRDLVLMAEYFDARFDELGPYRACTGQPSGGEFVCDQSEDAAVDWTPLIGAPNRENAGLVVHTDTIGVFFNMFKAQQLASGLAIVNTFFIIFIMVFSGLALSSVVTELAVRPLESMLKTVREIATTVFKFSVDVQDEDAIAEEAEGDYDGTDSEEMKLLKKVVQKLAIIAQLQSSNSAIEKKEDMEEEDLAVISMMEGKKVDRIDEAGQKGRRSMALKEKKTKAQEPQLKLEDFGVSQETYESWGFNAIALSKSQRISLAMFMITSFHDGEGFIREEDEGTLLRFLQACEREYLPNPFHNFAHAIDVCHQVARQMRLLRSENFLTELEQFSLLIASVGHDLAHPGVNNGFLLEVGHELAIQYNDRSPLENMHCSKLYQIVSNAETNVFISLTKEQFKEVRRHCIATILHTDIVLHFAMVNDLQMLYQMNSDVFNAASAEARLSPEEMAASLAEMDVFNRPETKCLIMNTIIHSADVSNPCRTWEVTKAWAHLCLEEFFAQGDREKMLGIPVQFLNDREKINTPNSQIGFLDGLIAPLVLAQVRIWPALFELGDNLGANIAGWRDEWVAEVKPLEDKVEGVNAKVLACQEKLEDAKHRRAAKPK